MKRCKRGYIQVMSSEVEKVRTVRRGYILFEFLVDRISTFRIMAGMSSQGSVVINITKLAYFDYNLPL